MPWAFIGLSSRSPTYQGDTNQEVTNQGGTNQGDRFLIEFYKFIIKNLSP